MLTSSVTVMFPASTFVVSTRPIRCASSWGLSEEMSSPLSFTQPFSGGRKPESVRNSVDFPTPFGPIKHVNSPACRAACRSQPPLCPYIRWLNVPRQSFPCCKDNHLCVVFRIFADEKSILQTNEIHCIAIEEI